MIQVENIETMNFAAAIRGMRNPMNSWAKSDTVDVTGHCNECKDFGLQCIKTTHCPVLYDVGTADLGLMRRLVAAGPEHRKFMRQIFVSMDITAPLYWWKEFDTYKVGTTANSCSTMHKLTAKRFTLEDVIELGTEKLVRKAKEAGARDEDIVVEVADSQVFNVVRGYSTIGKNMRVRLQVKPGLIKEESN